MNGRLIYMSTDVDDPVRWKKPVFNKSAVKANSRAASWDINKSMYIACHLQPQIAWQIRAVTDNG